MQMCYKLIFFLNFQYPIIKKEHAEITAIDFCSVAPYHYAVTSSARVGSSALENNFKIIAFCCQLFWDTCEFKMVSFLTLPTGSYVM